MGFGTLWERSSFGESLDRMTGDGPYFIIRDPAYRCDVATVWNWKLRQWCWQVDGEYNRPEDGFAYANKGSAVSRSKAGSVNTQIGGHTRYGYPNGQGIIPKNVRVVNAAELRSIRGLD